MIGSRRECLRTRYLIAVHPLQRPPQILLKIGKARFSRLRLHVNQMLIHAAQAHGCRIGIEFSAAQLLSDEHGKCFEPAGKAESAHDFRQ